MHVTGPCVEPQDVPVQFRHLQSSLAYLTLTDKAPYLYARGRGQVTDGFEMFRIGYGARRGDLRLHPLLLHGDQQQLAAAARHPDVHGADRLRGRRAAVGRDAVHARGRDGAGDARRRADAAARRGARGDRADPGRAARSAGRLRRVHLERRHEVGRARLRDARVLQGRARERPARPPRRAALPLLRAERVERGRRAGDVRDDDEPLRRRARRRATSSSTPPAGSRAG